MISTRADRAPSLSDFATGSLAMKAKYRLSRKVVVAVLFICVSVAKLASYIDQRYQTSYYTSIGLRALVFLLIAVVLVLTFASVVRVNRYRHIIIKRSGKSVKN